MRTPVGMGHRAQDQLTSASAAQQLVECLQGGHRLTHVLLKERCLGNAGLSANDRPDDFLSCHVPDRLLPPAPILIHNFNDILRPSQRYLAASPICPERLGRLLGVSGHHGLSETSLLPLGPEVHGRSVQARIEWLRLGRTSRRIRGCPGLIHITQGYDVICFTLGLVISQLGRLSIESLELSKPIDERSGPLSGVSDDRLSDPSQPCSSAMFPEP